LIHNRRPDHDIVCCSNRYKNILTNNPTYDNSFFNKVLGILSYCKTSDYLNDQMNMNEEKWNSYLKFCFVRNPYDRIVSGWRHFNIIFERNLSFNNYISHFNINKISNIEYGHVFMSQYTQIQDENGKCFIDIIGKFEHLEKDFCYILKKIGFEHILHVEKKENVSNKLNAIKPVFNANIINSINNLFSQDFVTFRYKMIK
jgi:hypothetical protein